MKQTQDFKFSLGEVVKEKITGFEGVIMAQCSYISGCTQYGIMSQKLDEHGLTQNWIYYDENRLTTLDKIIILDEREEEELPDTLMGGEDVRVSMNQQSPRLS